MKTEPAPGSAAHSTRFKTTRWTFVLSCAQSSDTPDMARAALTELCRAYWRPVFALICSHGHSPADAQDLTQDFFVMLLKGNLLSLADPSRGSFRCLLQTTVENFLSDRHYSSLRQKRGGELRFVPWDEWMAEAPSQLSIYGRELQNSSPERIFDVRWAATIAEAALRRLGEECEKRGRLRIFTALSKFLSTERVEISYTTLAGSLGVPEATVKRVLNRLRVRYRTILREEVARTVTNPAEIDDEIRYLCAALASEQ
jgi:DNA-directed RNA polymerase specialized sigma24 family protein